jgi:hypothetical protein
VKWREAIEKAEAYKAVGNTELYLNRDDTPPWEFVTDVRDGSGWRNEIPVGVTFLAEHPSGLTFKWFWDLETPEANGKSGYWIDASRIAQTLELLKDSPALDDFIAYLNRAADAIKKTADQALDFAQKQYGQERLLRRMVEGAP